MFSPCFFIFIDINKVFLYSFLNLLSIFSVFVDVFLIYCLIF